MDRVDDATWKIDSLIVDEFGKYNYREAVMLMCIADPTLCHCQRRDANKDPK